MPDESERPVPPPPAPRVMGRKPEKKDGDELECPPSPPLPPVRGERAKALAPVTAARARRRDLRGVFWVALTGASLLLILTMLCILALLLGVNGFLALWPNTLELVRLRDGAAFVGVAVNRDVSPEGKPRIQYKIGNRDLNSGADFRWVEADAVAERQRPADAARLIRSENGDFLGFFLGLADAGGKATPLPREEFEKRLEDYRRRWRSEMEPQRRNLAKLGDAWQNSHLRALKADYELRRSAADPVQARAWEDRLAKAKADEQAVKAESGAVMDRFNAAMAVFQAEKAVFADAAGTELAVPFANIVDVIWPNDLSLLGKARRFLSNAWALVSQYPREANTEGGLYPALFGTAMLVFIMAISAFPLGVAAGVYLREYARDNLFSRAARVAVNNLAGVPSIVYGIFGLGFFIYGMGGAIDRLFYPERVAAGISVFGGGGILWSSLTLGLLTLPVVIVATEEALSTVPSEIRQGSLALGATRFQTLWRVILPMASPGILTGFILAMARAAGEVAPLMLTGAVKSAHNLPLDGAWPFAHLERKFMHLGFHIYDMGFQSPNVEAAKPLVYLTALVLLALVFALNIAAFAIRKRMRDRYSVKGF